MENARCFINIYHWKAKYKPSYIKEGCEDNRVNLKCMKKSTAIEWSEMPSVGRIKVKVAEEEV